MRNFAKFLWQHKSWWLIPGLVVLVIVFALVWFTSVPSLSPFLYGH